MLVAVIVGVVGYLLFLSLTAYRPVAGRWTLVSGRTDPGSYRRRRKPLVR